MQFDHQGAFIKVEHLATDLLEVALQFKTLKPDTIILYTKTVSDTDQDTGYIQVVQHWVMAAIDHLQHSQIYQ